jgi:hypothetical protein
MPTKAAQQEKHRHHYVQRHYLEQWSSGGRMYCLRHGRIFSNNPVNLAVENDFYKMHDLNDPEIELIKKCAEGLPKRGAAVLGNIVNFFTFHSLFQNKFDSDIEKNEELKRSLKLYISNFEEDYHTLIENGAVKTLDEIRRGDISFYYDDDKCPSFMYYIAMQILRTKKLLDIMDKMPPNTLGIDYKKVWPAQRHMIATNFGCNLFLERNTKPITLVENNSSVSLLTSDQPAINLYPDEAETANVLAIYYPVSPQKAIIFGDLKDDIPTPIWNVDAEEVRYLNRAMIAAAHEMVFADSPEAFQAI